MKSYSRIRFLHCFRPETSPGNHLLRHGLPSKEHMTYRDIAGEPTPSLPSRKGTLSRAVKAVLFKTVLAHRVRERRRRRLNKSYVSMNSGMTVADCLDNEAARDDNTSSITRLSRLSSLSEQYSSLDQFALLSESQDGVADHTMGAKGKNMRRKRMICAFIVILAVTVLLGRSWAIFLASTWIFITCIYASISRRTNRARKGGTKQKQTKTGSG